MDEELDYHIKRADIAESKLAEANRILNVAGKPLQTVNEIIKERDIALAEFAKAKRSNELYAEQMRGHYICQKEWLETIGTLREELATARAQFDTLTL
jgi:hypothetical protein